MNPEGYVDLLYRKILNRPPDPDGLEHFAKRLSDGERLEVLIDAMMESDEYRSKEFQQPPIIDFRKYQKRPITIVDLGAQSLDDESHIYAPLINADLEWRCIGFEPQRDRLNDRIAKEQDTRLTMIEAFVGDGRKHTFSINSDSGSSSLLSLNKAFNSSFDDIYQIHTLQTKSVDTVRLDDAIPETDIDFLKLDIQGFELRALEGAIETLKRTSVVHCEVFFAEMYYNVPFFSQINEFMQVNGFSFIDFSHLNRYEYVDVKKRTGKQDRLIWGDAVFFKDYAHQMQEEQNLFAQAAIASLVYQKNGLAQSLLDRIGM